MYKRQSIALALRSKDTNIKITGFSKTKKTREEARKIGFCIVCENYEDCIKGADLVILCVPVGVMSYVTEKISPYLSRSVIVSDVGSVKESVVVEVQKKLPKGVFFGSSLTNLLTALSASFVCPNAADETAAVSAFNWSAPQETLFESAKLFGIGSLTKPIAFSFGLPARTPSPAVLKALSNPTRLDDL